MSTKELKRQKRIKNANNRRDTKLILEKTGVKFTEHNNGAHLIVTTDNCIYDLWSGTGKFLNRNTGEYGRGVFNLLEEIDL